MRTLLWTAILLVVLWLGLYLALEPHPHHGSTLAACSANLKRLGTALDLYAEAHQGRYPTALGPLSMSPPICPATTGFPCRRWLGVHVPHYRGRDTYSASYRTGGGAFTLWCAGSQHTYQGLPPDSPRYTSRSGLELRP